MNERAMLEPLLLYQRWKNEICFSVCPRAHIWKLVDFLFFLWKEMYEGIRQIFFFHLKWCIGKCTCVDYFFFVIIGKTFFFQIIEKNGMQQLSVLLLHVFLTIILIFLKWIKILFFFLNYFINTVNYKLK